MLTVLSWVSVCCFYRPWSCDKALIGLEQFLHLWFLVRVQFGPGMQIGQEWGRQNDKAKPKTVEEPLLSTFLE